MLGTFEKAHQRRNDQVSKSKLCVGATTARGLKVLSPHSNSLKSIDSRQSIAERLHIMSFKVREHGC